jgi:hypothetical protein
MLPNLINLILSQNIAPDIRNSIAQVQQVSARFDSAYQSFGKALTKDQQALISNNLDKLDEFFKSENGKGIVSMFAEEFEKFTKA